MKRLARFLTGFDAVLAGLLIFVTYRYFEVQFLFFKYLPLEENTKWVASCLVSVVVVFSLLVFSSHIDRFKISKEDTGKWIKWMMFGFTLFINAYFWEVWNPISLEKANHLSPALAYGFKAIISLFFAVFDYAYNHLFISKWNESQKVSQSSVELAKLDASISESRQKLSKIEANISHGSAKLSQILAREDPKVCPRCGQMFDNANQRNGHLRSCKTIPISNNSFSNINQNTL